MMAIPLMEILKNYSNLPNLSTNLVANIGIKSRKHAEVRSSQKAWLRFPNLKAKADLQFQKLSNKTQNIQWYWVIAKRMIPMKKRKVPKTIYKILKKMITT